MNDKRFWFGFVVTISWLGFAAYMVWTTTHPTELNAWGDFFAGFFAPMAFLWLVLGYLQQGEELKQSTRALQLQAEELRNSVEQQSQLVAVSREQLKHEFEALQEEREIRRAAARPKFVPQYSGSTSSGGAVKFTMKIANVGNTATKFRMRFDPPLVRPRAHNLALLVRDEVTSVELEFGEQESSIASINYIDADGMSGEVRFSVSRVKSRLEFGEIERVA
jgi:hypothetical protein